MVHSFVATISSCKDRFTRSVITDCRRNEELHAALSEIDPDDFSDDDMGMTHEMFVDSLAADCDRGHALFIQAH